MARKLLLVDDEPLLTEELQEALELVGYEVVTANSVPAALLHCENNAFDLIITDLKMPHIGGLDLVRALNDAQEAPAIIVLSGHGAESNRAEATSLGVAACFAKPIDPDVLIEQIEAVCQ